ncbi:MAG: tRNA (adenosine(37)-N6)-dimethylallyltransferase MiaA [Oligoflexia bacterium]|nr:tRNA (adenosine(37)-N6)-dimethylallyltransferase MiaA [Oligoflexia bacterium]
MVSEKSVAPSIAVLTGPTASGKTSLALELIGKQGIEIVNADSLLVYRHMDIGTAKPSRAEQTQIPHQLIDIRDPNEAFTAGDFKREAEAAIADITRRGKRALIVGGTGFYLKALLYGLWEAPESDPELRKALNELTCAELFQELEKRDPASALRIGINDHYRLVRAVELIRMSGKTPSELEAAQAIKAKSADPRFALWIMDRPNPELFARIDARARIMVQTGLIEETRALLSRFPGARPLEAVGYRETVAFLEGRAPAGRHMRAGTDGLVDEIALATRQLVKKQRTWFRGQAKNAIWFELDRDRDSLLQAWQAVYG